MSPTTRGSGTLERPLYALKVITQLGNAPAAYGFSYGARLKGKRYYRAMGRKLGHTYAPYDGPVLCHTGWHVWPVRAKYHPRGSGSAYSWRTMRRGFWWHEPRQVWLVTVRGRYRADGHKLAADEIRFVRQLTAEEQRQLRYNDPSERLRRILRIPKGADLLESLS